MSFSFQIAGSGYASNYAHIARKLPKVFSLVQIVGRGSQRSRELAELSNAAYSDRLISDLPTVAAVPLEQQLALLREGSGPILIEPELHLNTVEELRTSRKVFVANHWASLPAVRDFVASFLADHRERQIRRVEVECSERALFPTGSVLASLWPSSDIRLTLEHFGSVRTRVTRLPPLLIDYFHGQVDGNPLTMNVLRRSGHVDDGSDSPQIFNIRITTDLAILELVSPFGPIVLNRYLGTVEQGASYLSTERDGLSMRQLREVRIETNFLILDAFRRQIEGGADLEPPPYLMTARGIDAGYRLAALIGERGVPGRMPLSAASQGPVGA